MTCDAETILVEEVTVVAETPTARDTVGMVRNPEALAVMRESIAVIVKREEEDAFQQEAVDVEEAKRSIQEYDRAYRVDRRRPCPWFRLKF